MRRVSRLGLLLVICSSGCVYTTDSIGTPADHVFDESLIGAWEPAEGFSWIQTQGKVTITKKEEKTYAYEYEGQDGLRKGEFHLLKLGDAYFTEDQFAKDRFFVLRVALFGDRLRYRPMDDHQSVKAAKAFPRIKVTEIDRGGAILRNVDHIFTGPTKDLQNLFAKEMPLSHHFGTLRREGAGKVFKEGLASKKQRSLDLWRELHASLGIVNELNSIPTDGADEEVAGLKKDFVAAALYATALPEAPYFYQGLSGKPYLRVKENPAERAAWEEGQRLQKKIAQARDVLQKRYEVQFP